MKIVLVGMTVKPEVIAAFQAVAGPAAMAVDDEAAAAAALQGADAVVVSDNAYTPASRQGDLRNVLAEMDADRHGRLRQHHAAADRPSARLSPASAMRSRRPSPCTLWR